MTIDLQFLITQIFDRQRSISTPDLAAIDDLKIAFAPELATLSDRVADEIALRSPQRAFHQAASALRNRENRNKFADLFANSQIYVSGQSCISNCLSNNLRTIRSIPTKIPNTQPTEPTTPTGKTTYPIGTKISGEVLLSKVAIGGNLIPDDDNNDRRFNASYRARVNINTSLTGFDRLRVRFQKSDVPGVNRVTDSDTSRLSYQGNTEGRVVLNRLEYRFPIDNRTEIFATAKA